MYNAIICRYHEIAIKGNNRSMFEKRMVENMYYLLRKLHDIRILRVRGRIWVEFKDKSCFSNEQLELIKEQLLAGFRAGIFFPR